MTTLVTWKGVDQNNITSVYIASDSRFSWNNSFWDYGQKIFASQNFSEIIGYCGDVLIANNIINTLIHLIDNEIIYNNNVDSNDKNCKVLNYIKNKFQEYPFLNDTTIIHIIKNLNNEYSYYELKYTVLGKYWESKSIDIYKNLQSDIIGVYGSGKSSFDYTKTKFAKNDSAGTSRFIFRILCASISSGQDNKTGGSPQLIGLYKGKIAPVNFGIIYKEKKYVYGIEVHPEFNITQIEWRNENLERCDGETSKRIEGAQIQPIRLNK